MLHLSPRLIGYMSTSLFPGITGIKFPYHTGQCGVSNTDTFFLSKFLVYPLNKAAAVGIKPRQEFMINIDLVISYRIRHGTAMFDNGTHGVTAYLQPAADLTKTHPLIVQKI